MASMYELLTACFFVFLVSMQKIDASRGYGKWSAGKPAVIPTIVFGTVFCDQCLEKAFTFNTIAIPNVTATVECGDFQASNTTSEFGTFTIQIPADVAASKLPSCSVKVANDFSSVQGDLATCNTAVELQLIGFQGPSSPPSSLKSAQGGWPFHAAGPFFFQPPQALPACKSSPYVAAPHGKSAPPHEASNSGYPGRHPPVASNPTNVKVAAPPPHSPFTSPGPPFSSGAFPPHPLGSSASKTAPPPPSFAAAFPPHPQPVPRPPRSHFPAGSPPQPKPDTRNSHIIASPPRPAAFPGPKSPPFVQGPVTPHKKPTPPPLPSFTHRRRRPQPPPPFHDGAAKP